MSAGKSQKTKKQAPAQKRELKTPEYKSFRLSKRIRHPGKPLPRPWVMFKASCGDVWKNKKLFLKIAGVFALLYIVFVRGFAGSDIGVLKDAFEETGETNGLGTGLSLFAFVIGNASNPVSDVGGVYQFFFIVITTLAIIWSLRHISATKKNQITVREAFYKGGAPFVPYVLVLSVVGLQMVPAMVGASVYQAVITSGLAVNNVEVFAWAALMGASFLLSFYMVSSSVFASYIVTLPDMTPMKALYSARRLVEHRRFEVMRKIIFLPFIVLLIAAILFVPLLLYATAVAEFFILSYLLINLFIAHAYMYRLYRSLL